MSRLPRFLTLESRPTSLSKLGGIALGAVFAAVVGIMFVAPLIASYQAAVLSPGDRVWHPKAPGVVEEISETGVATVRGHDGQLTKVPVSELDEQ